MTPLPASPAPRGATSALRQPRRRRSGRAVANDERILTAALGLVRDVGYDGLGMSQVARRAGLNSTGALYGRFENIAELAVSLWTERAAAALADLDERVVGLLTADPADPGAVATARRVASELQDPPDELRAAFELLAVARRVEELEEVLRPDLEAQLARWEAAPGAPARRRAQVLGQLALTWGIGLLSLPATATPRDWWLLVAGTIGLADDRSRPRQDLVPTPVDPPRVDTGEPVKDVVLAAAAAVVARTGFERATVSRIARRAGYSTGVIYEHFDGKDDMIAALVEVLLQELYGTIADRDGTLLAAGTMAGASGSLLAGYVQPEATELQRLKVELYLTAAHQRPVADALARIIDHRTAAITERLLGLGLSAEQAAIAPFAGRAIDHGMALVDAVAGPLLDVDWRLYMQALVSRNTGPR